MGGGDLLLSVPVEDPEALGKIFIFHQSKIKNFLLGEEKDRFGLLMIFSLEKPGTFWKH